MAECLQSENMAHSAHATKDAVVFVRPKQVKLLHAKRAKIATLALEEMHRLIGRLANAESKDEFTKARQKAFSDYANLTYIVGNTFSMREELPKREEAVNQAIKATVEFFAKKASSILGEVPVREAVFCLDTLRRTYRLLFQIIAKNDDLPKDKIEDDRKLGAYFGWNILWAQLHVDCLQYAVTKNIKLDPEILHEILSGARLAVMAYSYARQAVQLRMKPESYDFTTIKLDDEDKKLLKESYSDYVESESSIDG